MALKSNFNMNSILQNHEAFISNVEASLNEAMFRAAQQIANLAKMTDTYVDRTNNLRSSIGFVLYKDGQKVSASFAKAGDGTEGDGASGEQKGENFADSVAEKYPSGYVVVLVAGMDYAAYVEAKGYDVITGSTMRYENVLAEELESIGNVTGIKLGKVE